jgi:hypothetical protein
MVAQRSGIPGKPAPPGVNKRASHGLRLSPFAKRAFMERSWLLCPSIVDADGLLSRFEFFAADRDAEALARFED